VKQEKFDSIIDTAKKLFARYGLRKTSIDDLARMARVAKATIYNYFGSKDRIYLEVLRIEADEILKKILLSVNEKDSPKDKLFTFAAAKFRYTRNAVNILNLDREGSKNLFPGAEQIRNNLFEQEIKIIQAILSEGVAAGKFYLNDAAFSARTIAHALKGFELNWLVHESREKIEYYLDEFLNTIFFGMLKEKKN